MVKYFFCALLFVCFFTSHTFAQQSYPPTLTVAQDGSGDHKTIQAAVNSVRDLGEKRVQIYIKSTFCASWF